MFNLMRYKTIYFLISLVFLVPGIISLVLFGLKPSIDFTGGSLIELKINNFDTKTNLEDLVEINSIQSSGENQYILRSSEIDNQQKDQIIEKLAADYGEVEELRFETVGPTMGRELLEKTLVAVVLVAGLITLYVWKQFDELKYGVCAILAMFHDSLILLGAFSLLGHFYHVEVDLLFVTALLTTLSFSIHDTIVVYDRIRELKREHRRESFIAVVNAAVVQTLSRSINNSVTIIVMLLALAVLGGETIRWFAIALLIGAVTGTYSSTFTAAPLLLLWDEIKIKFKSKF